MEDNKKKSYKYILILALIIALQVGRFVYSFAYEKEGTHSDEIWQYGLANSQNGPHLFLNKTTTADIYYNEWISGDVFKDYIMVADNERFDYGNVMRNMKLDTAPPLYSLILHTICSFFPNTFSLWYGFIINLVFYIITMIFAYKLMLEFSGKKTWALALVALLGFSIGMLDQMMFVRHYAMLTMFSVMFTYYHLKLIKSEGKTFRNILIKLAVVTFLGAMTHYFFTVYAFGMTAMFFMYYALKKMTKKLLAYSLVLLLAVGITLPMTNLSGLVSENTVTASAVAPGEELETVVPVGDDSDAVMLAAGVLDTGAAVFSKVLNIIYDVKFDASANEVMRCFFSDLFGITFEWHVPYLLWHGLFLLAVLGVVFLLVVVVGHKKVGEGKDKKAYQKLESIYIKLSIMSNKRYFSIAIVVAMVLEVYIVIGFANPWVMTEATNRYLFLIYPMIYMLVLGMIGKIAYKCAVKFNKVKFVDVAVVVSAMIILAVNNIFASCLYYFPRQADENIELKQLVAGSDCILSISSHWLMIPYSDKLYTAEDVFVTSHTTMDDYTDMIAKADSDIVYWIQDVDPFETMYTLNHEGHRWKADKEYVEKKFMRTIEEAFPDRNIDYVYKDRVFARDIYVYEIKR